MRIALCLPRTCAVFHVPRSKWKEIDKVINYQNHHSLLPLHLVKKDHKLQKVLRAFKFLITMQITTHFSGVLCTRVWIRVFLQHSKAVVFKTV